MSSLAQRPGLTRLTVAPADNDALRERLYAGEIFHLDATAASLRLVAAARAAMEVELSGPAEAPESSDWSPRTAQFRLSPEDFFARVGRLRKRFFTEPPFHELLADVLTDRGFERGQHAVDPLKLRTVTHRGFENPAAAPLYYPHRDTWYALPACVVVWWIALHDATSAETFTFYPRYFDRPVPNNSEAFDYDTWTRAGVGLKIGWQDPKAGRTALYPGLTGEFDRSEPVTFACRAGEIVLLSGGHFHQTNPINTGRTRFSLDFRAAHLGDLATGRGAPNVDSRCRGAAVQDYLRLGGRSERL